MTANVAPTLPPRGGTARAKAPRRAPRPPQLTVIEGAPRVKHIPVVVLCGVLLLTGLLSVLVLNTALARDSYEVRDMRKASAVLSDAQEALRERVRAEQAPEQVKAYAESQGMRTATVSAYVNIAEGKVYGSPRSAKDNDSQPSPAAPRVAPTTKTSEAKKAAAPTESRRSTSGASSRRPTASPSSSGR